jgi:hypothetical protein
VASNTPGTVGPSVAMRLCTSLQHRRNCQKLPSLSTNDLTDAPAKEEPTGRSPV